VINIYGPTLNKHKLDQYLIQKVHHKFFNCKSHKVIICVGRLSPQKGYDVIIKSFYYFQKIYKSKLIIIGEGSEEKKLKELCRSLNLLEHVDFIGSQSNPYKYIARSDIYVTASRWEGLSLSIIDSLYSGTNVVASDCQYGPSEILENGRYGILTKVNSEKNLLNGMIKSIKNSKLPYSKFKNNLRGKFFVNLNAKTQYLNIVYKFLKTKC
jgi:glycosyltransferase involved in cell wall biosynthesis